MENVKSLSQAVEGFNADRYFRDLILYQAHPKDGDQQSDELLLSGTLISPNLPFSFLSLLLLSGPRGPHGGTILGISSRRNSTGVGRIDCIPETVF